MPKPLPVVGCFVAFLATALSGQVPPGQPGSGQDVPRYGRDIRPLLADRCFRCHGPDPATREAGLRLDERDAAIAARDDGDPAIVPGDAEHSELWRRIVRHDDERMPPKESGKPPFDATQLATLRRWIDGGAPYEPHWAFVPPVQRALPDGTAPHPVDRWLASRRGDQPANPPADLGTQARRLFLVLTGLPPTPDEQAAFTAEASTDPTAYERLVDRLLGSEPYRSRHAEHLASLWLDAARYADTSGIHMDAGRQAWAWRDWLLRALRDDLPFDRFVTEQLAGDLLPGATVDQKVATGFLRNHVTTDEGGAIDEEYLVEYAAERTATVGSVFLGLTLGCARCHDHKYDPIRQQDYYQLFAFFRHNREPGLYSQVPDSNRALEPFLPVPTEEQQAEGERLRQAHTAAVSALATIDPAEQAAFATFTREVLGDGPGWFVPTPVRVHSSGGATLSIRDDGSWLASGANPATDEHRIEFELPGDRRALRWLCVEALPDPSLPAGKVGRAPNGNAVLQSLQVELGATGSEGPWQRASFDHAFADVEQDNGDFAAVNALAEDDGAGWAVDAHRRDPGPRRLAVLASAPLDLGGPTTLRLTLRYDSVYAQHTFGRVRLHLAAANPTLLDRLPLSTGRFHVAGPFAAGGRDALYDRAFGPEHARRLDKHAQWDEVGWRFDERLVLDRANGELPDGANATYVAQRVFAPSPRVVQVALGSDDGFQLFVDGQRVAERRVDRGVALDQDSATFPLGAGEHLLVLKVVNTGGAGGFALRYRPADGELAGALRLLALPGGNTADAEPQLLAAYRERFSPGYRARRQEVADLEQRLADLERATPRAMVMDELETPRETFVLLRGEYDKPDRTRPVRPELPAVFGSLPPDAPRNRLGLARWLVADDNPLVARVAVNRLWEFVFGQGLVRTSEDFGLQGEWPVHPELLDWLAVEFRQRGRSVRAMLRLLVTSDAFRQDARRSAAAADDPDNRLLTWFPRRRLSAEAIRDQALFASGLLVERFGGPSVKPYQPAGLWQEVAMLQSNTRVYQQDEGPSLWRRSLYTYWKRACPPPGLLTLDAPTREFCTIRRSTTNTPLQALVLWNDPQFVEAARALAQRTLADATLGDDAARLQAMHRRCTGEALDGDGLAAALTTLRTLRARFANAPADAAALLQVGSSARSDTEPRELAPLVVLASAFLNLDATLSLW
ncbi:MAG: PSD1 domain-containing protein [Planctomycetes bacterium]|nr:PSD1 domain-containing protein [Planctomycetota bacterium]